MSPAAHYDPASAPTVLTAQRGGLLTSCPAKMDFYQLQARFWQLEAEQPFSATETKFYFYWLNRFNAGNGPGERWPAYLRRFVKQVAADLSLDEKTVAKVATNLEKRGLLRYDPGTRTQAATWKLGIDDRKNSASNQVTAPQTSHLNRNNSAQSGRFEPRTSHDDRKNSAPYKEEEENSSVVENREEEIPPSASAADAAAGGGSEKKIEEAAVQKPVSQKPAGDASHTKGGAARPAAKPKTPTEPEHFAEFWQVWPKKEARADAARAFAKLRPDDQARAASRADTWLTAHPDLADPARYRFIPHATTWLNQARWTDQAPALNPSAASLTAHVSSPRPYPARSANGAKPTLAAGQLAAALCDFDD